MESLELLKEHHVTVALQRAGEASETSELEGSRSSPGDRD